MRTHLQVLMIEEDQEDHSEVLETTEETKIVRVLQVNPMKVHTQDQEVHLRHQILMMVIQTILHHTVLPVHMEEHTIAHQTAHMKDHMILIIQDHLIHHLIHHPIHHLTHHPIHIQNLQNNKEVMVDLEEVEEVLEDKEVKKDSENIR